MTITTAIDIKRYMSELITYQFCHIDQMEIINSDMSLLDMMNGQIAQAEDYHEINSFVVSSVLVKNFFNENCNVSFGIIYNKNRHHFVMFRRDSLYDVIVSFNKSYNINGFLKCCKKNPIEFMEENFPNGSLIQYGEITDFNIPCKDYFKNPTTLYA